MQEATVVQDKNRQILTFPMKSYWRNLKQKPLEDIFLDTFQVIEY